MTGRLPSDRHGRYVTRYEGSFYISNCPCARMGRSVECHCGEEQEILDWVWDPDSTTSVTKLQHGRQEAIFHPSYSSGTAAIRGTEVLNEGQHYWEIKMTTPVYGTDMMIGVGTGHTELNHVENKFISLLGQDEHSWGLSYLGTIHHNGVSERYAQHRIGQGTVIGIHLDTWRGTLSYFLNQQPQGVAFDGLRHKDLYPIISSTAARSGMKVITTKFFPTSLQFMCAQTLRSFVHHSKNVVDVVALPPGLSSTLGKELHWLWRSHRAPCPSRRPMRKEQVQDHCCRCDRASCNNCISPGSISRMPTLRESLGCSEWRNTSRHTLCEFCRQWESICANSNDIRCTGQSVYSPGPNNVVFHSGIIGPIRSIDRTSFEMAENENMSDSEDGDNYEEKDAVDTSRIPSKFSRIRSALSSRSPDVGSSAPEIPGTSKEEGVREKRESLDATISLGKNSAERGVSKNVAQHDSRTIFDSSRLGSSCLDTPVEASLIDALLISGSNSLTDYNSNDSLSLPLPVNVNDQMPCVSPDSAEINEHHICHTVNNGHSVLDQTENIDSEKKEQNPKGIELPLSRMESFEELVSDALQKGRKKLVAGKGFAMKIKSTASSRLKRSLYICSSRDAKPSLLEDGADAFILGVASTSTHSSGEKSKNSSLAAGKSDESIHSSGEKSKSSLAAGKPDESIHSSGEKSKSSSLAAGKYDESIHSSGEKSKSSSLAAGKSDKSIHSSGLPKWHVPECYSVSIESSTFSEDARVPAVVGNEGESVKNAGNEGESLNSAQSDVERCMEPPAKKQKHESQHE